MNEDQDLMSIRAAAKRLGITHSILVRQIKAGAIRRRPDGRVSLAEVIEDRAKNIEAKDVADIARSAGMTLQEAKTAKESALAQLRAWRSPRKAKGSSTLKRSAAWSSPGFERFGTQ